MHIKKRTEGNWFLYSFVEEHNHEMCPDDFNNSIMGRKNQKIDVVCSKKGLQLVLDEMDVQLLLDYFMHMQAEAPGFYYVIDFDEEAHMRNVFWVDPKDISTIPSSYILKRWTRKAKIIDATCQASTDTNLRVQRLNDICRLAIKLGQEGSLSGKAYKSACQALEEAMKLCVGLNVSMKFNLGNSKNAAQGLSNVEQKVGNCILKVPKRNVSKKRKVRGEAETLSIGIQDSVQNMEQLNHRSLRLHDSYISVQDLQGMDLGSRIPMINGYCGADQGDQGQGHLNSLSSLHDCCYNDQSLMQGVLDNSDNKMSKHLHN